MRRRSLLRLITLSAALVVTLCAAAWAASAVWKATQTDSNSARHIASFRWSEEADWFGGLSGLELNSDGTRFVAITDRSHLVEGTLIRKAGNITSVRMLRESRLLDADGTPIKKGAEDSEGLALAGDGHFYVSFESPHRVLEYTPEGPRALPSPEAFSTFRFNASFESLARDAAGQLLMISEAPSRQPQVARVWTWSRDTGWHGLGAYPEQDGFLPVGADFGPDGTLYVLERKFVTIGFRSRLRRFAVTNTGLSGGDVLLNTPLAEHDNLEGLSIWRDDSGALRATMISDDNFFWVQRTEIVEYRLPDPL